uniref:Uncharacterized protein n=1 Tax=Setaria digitata TaxID=48799 RepID=A0A915Q1W4_9BILA
MEIPKNGQRRKLMAKVECHMYMSSKSLFLEHLLNSQYIRRLCLGRGNREEKEQKSNQSILEDRGELKLGKGSDDEGVGVRNGRQAETTLFIEILPPRKGGGRRREKLRPSSGHSHHGKSGEVAEVEENRQATWLYWKSSKGCLLPFFASFVADTRATDTSLPSSFDGQADRQTTHTQIPRTDRQTKTDDGRPTEEPTGRTNRHTLWTICG